MEDVQIDKVVEIISKAGMLLMQNGIKSMTMDDISRQLGISKKTLYQYVNDKNDLVVKVMGTIVDAEKQAANSLCAANPNAIDMVFELTKEMSQKYDRTHPSIHYDMQQYHPDAWEVFTDFKENFIADCMKDNIERGIEQGLYRSNIDPFIISRVYTAKVEFCFDGHTFPPSQYDFGKIHLEIMRYHVRGIASDKGLEYLKQKVKQEKIEL
ncbi:MAG: TetR family transcriptional regulator [Bacteroidetes bacterium]|nr:TetR family transcriptional regulator [Bacteroidota bacterium]